MDYCWDALTAHNFFIFPADSSVCINVIDKKLRPISKYWLVHRRKLTWVIAQKRLRRHCHQTWCNNQHWLPQVLLSHLEKKPFLLMSSWLEAYVLWSQQQAEFVAMIPIGWIKSRTCPVGTPGVSYRLICITFPLLWSLHFATLLPPFLCPNLLPKKQPANTVFYHFGLSFGAPVPRVIKPNTIT